MTNAEARFNKSLRPRKPEGSLGRTAQDVHLDSHTAPELCKADVKQVSAKTVQLIVWFPVGVCTSVVCAGSFTLSERPYLSLSPYQTSFFKTACRPNEQTRYNTVLGTRTRHVGYIINVARAAVVTAVVTADFANTMEVGGGMSCPRAGVAWWRNGPGKGPTTCCLSRSCVAVSQTRQRVITVIRPPVTEPDGLGFESTSARTLSPFVVSSCGLRGFDSISAHLLC